MTLGELAAGDRVVAYYHGAPGEKSIQATTLVVRTSADMGEIAKAELADWKKRGTVGIVTRDRPGRQDYHLEGGIEDHDGDGVGQDRVPPLFARFRQAGRRQAQLVRGNQGRRPGSRAGEQERGRHGHDGGIHLRGRVPPIGGDGGLGECGGG